MTEPLPRRSGFARPSAMATVLFVLCYLTVMFVIFAPKGMLTSLPGQAVITTE